MAVQSMGVVEALDDALLLMEPRSIEDMAFAFSDEQPDGDQFISGNWHTGEESFQEVFI